MRKKKKEWTPATMGKKGGLSTSEAKIKACRENGKKPKKVFLCAKGKKTEQA